MTHLDEIINHIIKGRDIDRAQAWYLIKVDLWEMLHGAYIIRRHFHGNKIELCAIINAKSGNCSEDCKFCAQSIYHSAEIEIYPLVSTAEIRRGYERANKIGAHGFSIVTSGHELSKQELDTICATLRALGEIHNDTYLCASLGKLSVDQARKLKEAGLTKCHHNLETSERFFSYICTTHTYQEKLQTIRNIKEAGLRVCSGGILGLGETWEDRIEIGLTLRELGVDSIPLNFLIPIKGTALENLKPLEPLEILRIIALFRYLLPKSDIRICAGREKNLRDLQSWIFYAGATGMMIGGYLTQVGRAVMDDLQMIKDLGFALKSYAQVHPTRT